MRDEGDSATLEWPGNLMNWKTDVKEGEEEIDVEGSQSTTMGRIDGGLKLFGLPRGVKQKQVRTEMCY